MKLCRRIFICPKQQKTGTLLEEVEAARREWHIALQQIDQVTCTAMVDKIISKIDSAERRFIALLKQARKEGVTVWPGELAKVNSTQPTVLPKKR